MRFLINGRRYRLRETIEIRLQGIALVLLSIACHMVQADGAAITMSVLGICFMLSQIKPRKRSLLYCFAKTVVDYEDERDKRRSA